MPRAPEQLAGHDDLGAHEVIGLGPDSPDDVGPLSNLGLLEIDPPAPTREDPPARANPGLPRWRLRATLALAFVLGLATGGVGYYAPGDATADAPVALAAGPVSVDRDVIPLSPSAAIAPVSVEVHNSGRDDVEVLSVMLVAWQQDGAGPHGRRWPCPPARLVPSPPASC